MNKAVIFDVGGVLLDYDRDGTFAGIASRADSKMNADRLGELIGELDLSGGHQTIEDLFNRLVAQHGFGGSLDELEVAWCQGLQRREWVGGLLSELNERATLYVLSDTNAAHWNWISRQILDLSVFEHIFLSHELKMTKRHTDVFKHVIGAVEFAPQDCLFIDDTYSNVALADSVALRAHHYQDSQAMQDAINQHLS